jgi:hypothetical protein
MCGCNKVKNSGYRTSNQVPIQNKVVSSFITRSNILQKNVNPAGQNSPLPTNQNKLSKNGEIIRKALLEKNKNNNKKYFK